MTMSTHHNPRIRVTGLAQSRDVEKVYNEDLTLREVIPKETHYLLQLEAPTGKFEAEVTKEVWNKHILPAWRPTQMPAKPVRRLMELTLKLHELVDQGLGDEDGGEADKIRDEMDSFWRDVSREDHEVAQQLSAALNRERDREKEKET